MADIKSQLVELVGEDVATQVVSKLPEGKSFHLLEEGSFIPKSRFDEVNTRYKDAQTALQERDSKLAELTKNATSIDELKQALVKTENDYQTKIKELETTYTTRERDMLIDSALTKSNARNPKAVRSLLDMNKVAVENGQIKGLDEQLTELLKTDDYLFNTGTSQPFKAGNPSNPTLPPKPTRDLTKL
jgi:chromosome segregation ATPase